MEPVWAEFLARPNRFTLVVRVGRRRALAHLPNPGRLAEVLSPGRRLLLRPAPPGRRTAFTAVGADLGPFLVSLDSTLPNRLFPRFLAQGALPELRGFRVAAREPRLGEGRADFLLVRGRARVWVEVKSVTLVEAGVALFPDAPTRRGQRHLGELARVAQAGEGALVLFVVQRPDAERFGPNARVDPRFAAGFCQALAAGMEARALVCAFDGRDLIPRRLLGREALVLPAPCAPEPPALP
ncbi:MAG: DNA/RNA nuclease SfsA [Candidatus Bipolaricaulota bacterium]|nr:DNA/RNA nuclease SfsA [Candidatus Bipolaricaulota bacterium]MDW8152264.1 DNA/RNA nuclease SfsA [Candidatus Bipolaricaulota bacterium]